MVRSLCYLSYKYFLRKIKYTLKTGVSIPLAIQTVILYQFRKIMKNFRYKEIEGI